MKHETQLGADVVIGALFVRQFDAQADGFSSRFGRAAIGRFQDAWASSRADYEAPRMIAERHGPGGDSPRQLARLFVIAGHLDSRFRFTNSDAVMCCVRPLIFGLSEPVQIRECLVARE